MSTKRTFFIWTGIVVGLAAIVVIFHAAHILPLSPAPPYENGEKQMITPSNPWSW
jgi:hypothetical protein